MKVKERGEEEVDATDHVVFVCIVRYRGFRQSRIDVLLVVSLDTRLTNASLSRGKFCGK